MKIPTYLYLAAFALIASVEAKKGHHEDTYDPRLKVVAATSVEKRAAEAQYHTKPSLDPRLRDTEPTGVDKREAKKGQHEDTYDPRLKVAAATTLEIVKKDVTNAVVTAA